MEDEDRRNRLVQLETTIQDNRSIINVDCLLDAIQALVADCDHPAIRKIKNVDAFVNRCKFFKNSVATLLILQQFCSFVTLTICDLIV